MKYGIVGNSDELNRALDIALQVAPTDLSVLIMGESGVGKEVIPRLIHDNSVRKHNKYMAINCGSVPEGLIDDELFGHVKGAFTGATEDRDGYFASVNGGTLFLDEVGELPPATQVRLLRILETGEYLRLGSSEVRKTDVRVVAATNVKMQQAIREGKFREDLYYRLNTIPIQMPPLRDRGDDILLIFRKFAAEMSEMYQMPRISLTEEAQQMMLHYRWPGNIRELRNLTRRLSILEKEREIGVDILQKYLTIDRDEALPVLARGDYKSTHGERGSDEPSEREQMLLQAIIAMRKEIDELKAVVHSGKEQAVDGGHYGSVPMAHGIDEPHIVHTIDVDAANHRHGGYELREGSEEVATEPLTLAEQERKMITEALQRHAGNRKAAAADLDISERTLYRKLKEYGEG